MKFLKIIIAVIITLTLSNCSNKNPSPSNKQVSGIVKEATGISAEDINKTVSAVSLTKKYPIKSGIITFENNGIASKKKTIIYFDDYGIKERNETYNRNGKIDEVRFSDGDKMFLINNKYSSDKVAYIMGPGHSGTEMKFVAAPFKSKEEEIKYSFKKLPNMLILGRDCEVYSIKNQMGETIFAGWNNLLLYSKVNIKLGSIETKAVKFEENASISPSLFIVPGGYQIKNM